MPALSYLNRYNSRLRLFRAHRRAGLLGMGTDTRPARDAKRPRASCSLRLGGQPRNSTQNYCSAQTFMCISSRVQLAEGTYRICCRFTAQHQAPFITAAQVKYQEPGKVSFWEGRKHRKKLFILQFLIKACFAFVSKVYTTGSDPNSWKSERKTSQNIRYLIYAPGGSCCHLIVQQMVRKVKKNPTKSG